MIKRRPTLRHLRRPRGEPVVVSRRAGPIPGDRAPAPSLPRLRQRAVLSRAVRRGGGRPLIHHLGRRSAVDPPAHSGRGAGIDGAATVVRPTVRCDQEEHERVHGAAARVRVRRRLGVVAAGDPDARLRVGGVPAGRSDASPLERPAAPPSNVVADLQASPVGRDRSRHTARGLCGRDRPLGGALGPHRRHDSPQAPARDRLLRPGGGRAGPPRGRERRARLGDRFRSSAERSRCYRATGRSSSRPSDRPCSRRTGTGR